MRNSRTHSWNSRRHFLVVAAVALALTLPSQSARSQTFLGCFGGHAYYLTSSGSVHNAMAAATAMQNQLGLPAYLVALGSAAEDDWLRSVSSGWKWIGLNDLAVEGTFQWSNGEPVVYTNWFPGEPTFCGQPSGNTCGTRSREHYVQTHHHQNIYWNDLSDLNTFTYAPGVIEVDLPQPTFDVQMDPGSTTVNFVDTTPGATVWSWDFGDGQTSTVKNPTNTYVSVPTCHSRTFTVKHWAGVGAACQGPLMKTVTVSNFPAAGSAGRAYVIVADVAARADVKAEVDVKVDLAAEKAVQRLQLSGYDVMPRIGYATSNAYATIDQIRSALRDHNVTAIWLIAHAPSAPQQMAIGQSFWVGDGQGGRTILNAATIADDRAFSGSNLRELSLFACNSRIALNAMGTWRADPNTAHIYAKNGLIDFASEQIAVENGRRCDPPPEGGEFASNPAVPRLSTLRLLTTAPYEPMLLRDLDGTLGDDLYGTVAGSGQTMVADVNGRTTFADDVAGISGYFSGYAQGDTVDVWMNRYTQPPAESSPPMRAVLSSFFVGSSSNPTSVHLTFKLGTLPIPWTSVELWGFHDSLRVYEQLPATMDPVAQTLSATTTRLGIFVVSGTSSVVGVDVVGAGASLSLKVLGSPVVSNEPVKVAFTLPTEGSTKLQIFSVSGALVANVLGGKLSHGPHVAHWNGVTTSGMAAPSGVYFLVLQANGSRKVARIVIAR